jgi:RHS repeat-associated protein
MTSYFGRVSTVDSAHPHQLSNLSQTSSTPTCSSKGTVDYTGSYDSWGNTTSQVRGGITRTLSYDGLDHLVRWTSSVNSQEEWNLYDASGERVLRRTYDGTNTVLTVFAFGVEEHAYSYSGSGSSDTNTSNIYYYTLGGQELGTWDGTSPGSPTTNFLLTDTLGSVVSSFNNLPNGAATVLGDQVYGPYGNRRVQQGTISTSKGFTGQFTDFVAGLDYYGARYYDPVVGVFVSADTVQGNAQGMNPYGYVGGNPETQTDPTGQRYLAPDGSTSWTNPNGAIMMSTPAGETSVIGWHTTLSLPLSPFLAQSVGSTWYNLSSLQNIPAPAARSAPAAHSTMRDLPPTTSSCGLAAALCTNMRVNLVSGTEGEFSPLDLFDFGAGDDSGVGTGGSGKRQTDADISNTGLIDAALADLGEGCEEGLSFAATTRVATVQGEQAIGTLKVGEQVWSYNPTTKKMEVQPILHVWINHDNDLVDLTITKTAHGKTAKPESEVIHTNKRHPFLTVEKGFLPVGQMKMGMHVVEANGGVGMITGWKVVPGVKTMYNLEVQQNHTYTVGMGQWVVHNCGDDTTTLYRAIGEEELQDVLRFEDYGLSPHQGGKYFSLTEQGARDFANTSFNAEQKMTITSMEVPSKWLDKGFRFYDPGGAGDAIHFADDVLPDLYQASERPKILDASWIRNLISREK